VNCFVALCELAAASKKIKKELAKYEFKKKIQVFIEKEHITKQQY